MAGLKKALYFKAIKYVEGRKNPSEVYYYLKKGRSAIFNLKKPLRKALNSGSGRECNICKWQGKSFIGDRWNKKSICPNCGLHFRHRMLIYAFENISGLQYKDLIDDKKVIHFAPEQFLKELIPSRASLYKTADICDQRVDFNTVDVTNMPYMASDFFDTIIICDVLEHVPNDKNALSELHRILKPGGCAIITVPQQDHVVETLDDPTITDPIERERTFGYYSHLRFYGSDFQTLLENSGFSVTTVSHETLSEESVKRHVLVPEIISEDKFVNNLRRIFFAFKK